MPRRGCERRRGLAGGGGFQKRRDGVVAGGRDYHGIGHATTGGARGAAGLVADRRAGPLGLARGVAELRDGIRGGCAQLAFEQTRSNPEWRPPPGVVPSVGRVFELVDRTLVEVLRVKDALGLRSPASESLEPDSIDHDMLVAALFNAGGLVNALLDRGSSPGGSYDAITVAVHIALELHLALVESKLPLAPEFTPSKTSTDVFERLLLAFDKIREIGAKADMPVATLQAVKTEGVEYTPDDVSNVISLVIAELFWLHSLVEGAEQPVRGYSAGRKLPADAFQRAGLLIGLLDDLIRRTTANDFKSG